MSFCVPDQIAPLNRGVPSFAEWGQEIATPVLRNRKHSMTASPTTPILKRVKIEEIMAPFFQQLQQAEEDASNIVRNTVRGSVDLQKLDMKYEDVLISAIGERRLPSNLNLIEHKEVFKRYVSLLSNQIEAGENNPFQIAKIEWMKKNVLKVQIELDQLAQEVAKVLPVVSETFRCSIRTFHEKAQMQLEGKPKVPYVVLHESNLLKEEIEKIERAFEEKVFASFHAIRAFKRQWLERSNFFAAQYRYNFLALKELEQMRSQELTEGEICIRDVITSKLIVFRGSVEGLEKDIQWVKKYYSLISEVESLYLSIVEDGILKEYKQLHRVIKSSLEELTRKI